MFSRFARLTACNSSNKSLHASVSALTACTPAAEPADDGAAGDAAVGCETVFAAWFCICAIRFMVCSTRASISAILRFMTSNSFVPEGMSAKTSFNRLSEAIKLLSLSVSAFILNDSALIFFSSLFLRPFPCRCL